MKIFIVLILALLSLTADEKEHQMVEFIVDEIMEEMDYYSSGAKSRARRKEFDKQDFKDAVKELKLLSDKLAKVKHPEKRFNDFSIAAKKRFDTLQEAIEKGETKSIPALWKAAYKSCKACHKVYD